MTEVYYSVNDLIYPSPVSLKEISSIAVAAEIWRWHIGEYRKNGSLENLSYTISIRDAIPDLPSVIYDIIEDYIRRFAFSLMDWLHNHSVHAFGTYRNHRNDILNDFDDFVRDWNGCIHCHLTAKRMMICGRLSEDEKFEIACVYCFEEDINRIWPSVSGKVDGDIDIDRDFEAFPQLCYWVCAMRNELDEIYEYYVENSLYQDGASIDEIMLGFCYGNGKLPSIQYFWDRVVPENRLREAEIISWNHKELFARFILPKLNEQQINTIITEHGSYWVRQLFTSVVDKHPILPILMYIKDRISESSFTILTEGILRTEIAVDRMLSDKLDSGLQACCKLWRSVPNNFKRSAIKNTLPNSSLFKRERDHVNPTVPRKVTFLITMLWDATFEERREFWYKNWSNLINSAQSKDLHQIMKLCFRNEEDIILFKETTLSTFENISEYCAILLKKAFYKELNNFFDFCCLDREKRRNFKRRLLDTCFLGDGSTFYHAHVCEGKLMDEFINDAYETVDQAADYKRQLWLSPTSSRIENALRSISICGGDFLDIITFVDRIGSTDEMKARLKKCLFDSFKEHLMGGKIRKFNGEAVEKFLLWCLGSEDEITKLKQSLHAEKEFIMAQYEVQSQRQKENRSSIISWIGL